MKKAKFKVVEKFVSIEGEGIRSGFPAIFLRFAGCNLNCSYCDTRYATQNPDYEEITLDQILEYVNSIGFKRVTLTGGEPLIQPHIHDLIDSLIKEGFEVNIETNGSVDIRYVNRNAIITMDYKCPSSGMEDKMLLENIKYLGKSDVLKFVVGTNQDLERAFEIIRLFEPSCNIYFSPVHGKIEPKEIVSFILSHKLQNCRLQLQLHKIIWPDRERGV
ncbi:Radical SAM domain protein [Caldicellulosiruptor saccharolyticus DSM 8903]|uniref:7-carboxy-7-deazaguanine synthase n=1 Tax=Caldicellulosiruptor saccharolyticus (strain ATCC 43494 / DSM 8903 / Tp8T 6331) TaxID=351627 RepID=A4XFS3_CALS8|nr:putative 7-carboxy-7-deazaguanine synthase QueE [Caldicellulosiruptor saccharolyticus]ABP65758.1 Radical SAM domain protein [Caldicellulosiruptor saccharolyticus DSM 8903]